MSSENVNESSASSAVEEGHGEPSRVPVHSSPGTGWKIGVTAVLFAAVLGGGYYYGIHVRHHEEASLKQATEEAADTPQTVEVVPVRRADVRQLLQLPGEARALNETTVYARTSGYIKDFLVDIGDHVKQGQTLAIIDAPELDDQLTAAKAKVVQAKSNAKLAEASANFAKLTYERWEAAAPDGVVSQQERDEKKSELDTTLAKVASANAEIDLDQAEVSRLQTLVNFKRVIAPFDGTITQRHIDIGDLVMAGSSSNTTSLFSIVRSDKLRIYVEVPQSAAGEITDGMHASVTSSEFPGRTFTGIVDRTADAIDRVSRTLRVEVLVPNPDMTLKAGQYVQVAFETDRSNPPLEIPAAALSFRTEGAEVAVVGDDGTVTFKPIKIGLDLGDHLEVAEGLSPTDRVALNISSDVMDGQKVLAHDSSTAKPNTPPVVKGEETKIDAKRASAVQVGG